MSKVRTLCALLLGASALPSTSYAAQGEVAAEQQTPVDSSDSFTFDADSYSRLRVQVEFSGAAEQAFAAEVCPSADVMGVSLLDLVKGDRTAAITLTIGAPQIQNAELNVYNVQIDRKFLGTDCTASFRKIDFKSPLYLGAQYNGTTLSITPKLVVAKKPTQLFAQSLDGLINVANALSPLPAPFLNAKDKVIERTTGQLSSTQQISVETQLNLGPDGRHVETWSIPGDADQNVPDITIVAFLEEVKSYFEKPGGGWDAATILSRNFPSGSIFSYTNFGEFVANLGSSYTDMVAASDVAVFDVACRNLQTSIAKQGFSPMDRSLVLWATTQTKPNLRNDARIDHTQCLGTTFAELKKFETTKDITARPLVIPETTQRANEAQMRAAAEFDSRLWVFMTTDRWDIRRTASERMFSWPLVYKDHAEAAILTSDSENLSNPDQWQTKHQGGSTTFASRVGCYAFVEGSETSDSYMLALVDMGSADAAKEAVVRLTFGEVPPTAAAAPVSQFDIYDPADQSAQIDILKQLHGSSCGGGSWRPKSLRS